MTANFNDDLAFSHAQAEQPWWESIYRLAFHDFACMADVRGDGWAQRGGIDRVVTLSRGKTLLIDEKVRRKNYGDIALEYVHRYHNGGSSPGWVAKDLACDFLAYAIAPIGVCYLLPFETLRRAWRIHHREWVETFGPIKSYNPDYVSISVPVPPAVLLSKLGNAMSITWLDVK